MLLLVSCLTYDDIMDKLAGKEMTNDPPRYEEVDQDNISKPSDENEEQDQHVHNEPADEDV